LSLTVTVIPANGLLGVVTVIVSGWLTWPRAVGANCTVIFSVTPGARSNAPPPAVIVKGPSGAPTLPTRLPKLQQVPVSGKLATS
jgi:hypothetical protein